MGAEKNRSRSSRSCMPRSKKALAEPDVERRIAADGGEPFNLPLAEITPFVQAEIVKWADVVKRAGVTVQ
jgi:tripartite-type tricarboxylate transporter receptor subunit TctC